MLFYAWFFVSVKKLQTFFSGFDNGLLAKNDLRERGRRGREGVGRGGKGRGVGGQCLFVYLPFPAGRSKNKLLIIRSA